MKLYLSVIRTSFKNELVYPLSIVISSLGTIFTCFAFYYLWTAIYKDLSIYADVSLDYMVTYAILVVLINSCQGENVGLFINQLVRTGNITTYILKPINFINYMFYRSLGQSIAKLLTSTFIAYLIAHLFINISFPPNTYNFIAFIISVLLGYFISFCILFIVGTISFYTLEIWGIEFARFAIMALLSGSIIPWWFFPDWIQLIVKYSPINFIVGIPTSIYIGKLHSHEIITSLGVQLLWLIIFFVIINFFFAKAIKKMSVFGG